MSLPNITSMLPSASRRVLTEYLLTGFRESPKNIYGDSQFDYAKALQLVREAALSNDTNSYISRILPDCFETARETYLKETSK